MTQPAEGFPDEDAGLHDLLHDAMSDDEADAVLDESLIRLNRWRTAQGLPLLQWADEAEPTDE